MLGFLALTGFLFGVVIISMFMYAKSNASKLEPTEEEKERLNRYSSGFPSQEP